MKSQYLDALFETTDLPSTIFKRKSRGWMSVDDGRSDARERRRKSMERLRALGHPARRNLDSDEKAI